MRIERLMAAGQLAGGEIGQQARAGAVAQPVQRGARGGGGSDRLIDRRQFGGDLLPAAAQ